jgi:hypothetical protein
MAQATAKPAFHRWSFRRLGGVDQVQLDKGADILHLDELDLKLWVALSCPVKGLEIDSRTLELLDSDNDAHVRPPEILAAVRWLRDVLVDGDALVKGEDGVALANLRQDTAEGRALLASAQHILKSLGRDSASITVADATKTADVFAKARRNADGVVPPDTVDDEKARAVATEIVTCIGGLMDRSGKLGYDQVRLDGFFAACADFDAWRRAAEADAKNVLPLGDGTAAAHAAFAAVRNKVDDYFGRCRLAAFDARALAAVNIEEQAYVAIAAKDLTLTAKEVAQLPLSLVEANKPLSLTKGVNPAWAQALDAMRNACCKGNETLPEAEWIALCAKFDAYGAWLLEKAGGAVEALGIARVRAILAGNQRALLQQAIADDLAVAIEVDAMTRVERLTRLHRDFAKLLNNYVSFTDFYSRRGAIFQAGRLYLDGRACDMCFHVHDAGKHAKMAPMSNAFLAYVDCTRPGSEKMSIACAFTAGASDNLFEGRNGIFYDRKGNDWDATIAKVVSAPISIRQAFWSPYKNVVRSIQQMAAKRAADADAASADKLAAGAIAVGNAVPPGAPAAPAAPPKKFDVGTIAALGVAVSGITGVFTGLLLGFLNLGAWIPLGIVGILLGISGPSMVIAWLKLRQRNLGPILDANGWAVNTLTKVNIPLGTSLTELPKIPAGSRRSFVDPFAPKKSPWPKVIALLLVLAGATYGLYRFNLLHRWFPGVFPAHHVEVQHAENELATEGGKTSGKAGETIVFVVKNKAPKLAVTDHTTHEHVAELPVADGKATFAITADTKAGTFDVSDGASSMTITIVKN